MTGLLFCTACGAQGKPACKCGKPFDYIPAAVAAKLAIAAHPDWSDRRIADAVGCSDRTIGRTRKESVATNVATERREGKDGKQYKAHKPPVADAVTVRPTVPAQVSEVTEVRRAPYSFIADISEDAESAVQDKMVASLDWLENTVCDPKIDWGVVIDAVGAKAVREIIEKLKSNLDQYQPYFERLMKLAPPKMAEHQATQAVRGRMRSAVGDVL
jgi:hypothetical protein